MHSNIAYCAFVYGILHKWSYVCDVCTIESVESVFQPLEDASACFFNFKSTCCIFHPFVFDFHHVLKFISWMFTMIIMQQTLMSTCCLGTYMLRLTMKVCCSVAKCLATWQSWNLINYFYMSLAKRWHANLISHGYRYVYQPKSHTISISLEAGCDCHVAFYFL